jgi:nucleoside-diphosphate-sugar epimerase
MTSPSTPLPNLILGCGYVGRRVAARWLSAGSRVCALTRGNALSLGALGIEPIQGDVLDGESCRKLPPADTLLHAVARDRTSTASMRDVVVGGLARVLEARPECRRFIYISSTSVYGQGDGCLVDESSPTEPVEDAGKVILEAEQLLREQRPDAIILRFAGIYGPDRLLRKQAILAGEPLRGDADRWLNLVHVDDGVAAVLAAQARGTPRSIYNIADDHPVSRREFYQLLGELLRGPAACFEHRSEPGQPNRRISNRAARQGLGWSPLYPSYREGLPAAVRASSS